MNILKRTGDTLNTLTLDLYFKAHDQLGRLDREDKVGVVLGGLSLAYLAAASYNLVPSPAEIADTGIDVTKAVLNDQFGDAAARLIEFGGNFSPFSDGPRGVTQYGDGLYPDVQNQYFQGPVGGREIDANSLVG